MADTARAPSRGLILLSAALRRFAVALGPRGLGFDLTLRADPSSLLSVRRALRRIARAAGLDDDRAFALQVAVGEAITNVIEHAYGAAGGIPRLSARREGDVVRVRARRDGGTVVVEVMDRGRWRRDLPAIEQRSQGIRLMRGLADSVEIRTAPSGTTVRLAVSRAASPGAAPEEAAAGPSR
jgi:anti-sigma regulatory factor (Ser/Thr protein kinase)